MTGYVNVPQVGRVDRDFLRLVPETRTALFQEGIGRDAYILVGDGVEERLTNLSLTDAKKLTGRLKGRVLTGEEYQKVVRFAQEHKLVDSLGLRENMELLQGTSDKASIGMYDAISEDCMTENETPTSGKAIYVFLRRVRD